MDNVSRDKAVVIALALLCIILYGNTLWSPFVFDDLHSIQNNLFIKHPRYASLFFQGYYTSETIVQQGMFRPLLLLTFALNYFFSGLRPLGYHLINILLHFLNAVLLYSLLKALKKDIPWGVCTLVTLLFAAHPLNTEAVGYITSRSDVLLTFFILCGCILYIRGKIWFSLVLYLLALLTKEIALVFGLLIIAYDFSLSASGKLFLGRIRQRGIFYIILIAVTASYWSYRGFVLHSHIATISSVAPLRSAWSNILVQSAVTFFYLRMFLWPYPLSIHHPFPGLNSLWDPIAFSSVAAIASMGILVVALKKKQPLISFCIAWYLICLSPKFYARLYVVAAEHHFYLASIGVYIMIAALLSKPYLRWRRPIVYAAVSFFIACSILTWSRNHDWSDAFRLWSHELKVEPSSTIAMYNLGVQYLERGDYAQARRLIEETMARSKTLESQVSARIGLAFIAEKERRFPESVRLLEEAAKIDQRNYYIYNFLGRAYAAMGREKEAEGAWRKGLSLSPRASEIQGAMGRLYLARNDHARAEYFFREAIESNPDSYMAYYELGKLLEERQDTAGAIKAYRKSVALNPAYAYSRYALGTLFAQQGDLRALRQLEKAAALAPDFPEAHNNLAVLYASMSPPRLESARLHAQKALSLGYKVDEAFLKMLGLPRDQAQ